MSYEILEKLVTKKQISLNSYFKNDSKTKKIFSSSILRLFKYKTVEENWIEKSLAVFDARNWL